MINVKGTLLNPVRMPVPNAQLRFTALTSEGGVVEGVSGLYHTNEAGEYEFTLVQGRYDFEVLDSAQYHLAGVILVDEYLPSNLDLPTLLKYATPHTPPLLNTAVGMGSAMEAIRNNDEWNRQGENQVRDDQTFVNEDKAIHKQGTKTLSVYTDTERAGSALAVTQQVAMDTPTEKGAATTSEVSAGGTKATTGIGAKTGKVGHWVNLTDLAREYTEQNSPANHSLDMQADMVHYWESQSIEPTSFGEPRGYSSEGVSVEQGIHQGEYLHKTGVEYSNQSGEMTGYIEDSLELGYSLYDYPVKGYRRLDASRQGVKDITVADLQVVMARDGHEVVRIDTNDRKIVFDAEIEFKNTDDFIGEEGWSYDYEHEYSNDQIDWNPVYEFGDIWRRSRKFKFQESKPDLKQYITQWEIVQLNAQDGLPGDNFYMEYQYTTTELYPNGWHLNYTSADDWRRWRTVRKTPTGTEISEWQDEPIKGTDGPEGWIPEFQIYYGPDGTQPLYTDQDHDGSLDDINLAHWHTNLVDEDVYKYERKVWWATQADFVASRTDFTMVPHVIEPWVGPAKIKPVAGEDYGNQNALLFLYQRSASKPTVEPGNWKYVFSTDTLTPVGSANGWHTGVYAGLEPMWVATGRASSMSDIDPSVDNWDVDLLTANGTKTATAFLYQATAGSVTSVKLPTGVLQYNFATGKVEGTLTQGWLVDPPNNVGESKKLWRTFAPVTAEAYTVLEPIAVDDWEGATVLAQNGSDGSTGVNGANTVIVYLYKRATAAGANPTATCRYTFSTKKLTGMNNSWETSVPDGNGNVWIISATASSIGDFDDIAPNEWSGAALFTAGGNGIAKSEDFYQINNSNTVAPTSWVATVPTPTASNRFLWNYEKVTYTDGTTKSTPPAVIGTYSEDGASIVSITEYFQVSGSNSTPPSNQANWPTKAPLTTPSNKYLWNYEKVTYDMGKAATTTTPVVIGVHGEEGLAGINSATIMVYRRSTTALTDAHRPGQTVTYTFSSGAVSGLNNGWTTTIPTGTDPIWVTTATALSRDATDSIFKDEWATPQILASSGATGTHGAGTYVVEVASEAAAVNDNKDNRIVQVTGRSKVKGDILSYTDSITGTPQPTFAKSYIYTGTSWDTFIQTFKGNVMINGILAASSFKGDSALLDNIKVASSQNPDEVVISGSGKHSGAPTSNYRIWAGHANAAAAPFSVDKVGNLKASKGTFTAGCTFQGTLDVSSASSGARMVIKNDQILVYNDAGALVVKIGRL